MQGGEPPKRGQGGSLASCVTLSHVPSQCLQTLVGPGCGCPGAEPHVPWALHGRPTCLPEDGRSGRRPQRRRVEIFYVLYLTLGKCVR